MTETTPTDTKIDTLKDNSEQEAGQELQKQEGEGIRPLLTPEELNEYHKLIYPWQQHLDPTWNKYYYFNVFTNESIWELPEAIK